MMKNKAQATSLSQMLVGLTVIGLVGMLVFFLMTRGQEIEVKVEENEILRKRVILTNVLISSDELVYTDDSIIHRGILDKRKLDVLGLNALLSEISYPKIGYSVKIVDLDNNNKWVIGDDFKPVFESPVAIRYSEDNVHVGLLSINFDKGSDLETHYSTTTLYDGATSTECSNLFNIEPLAQLNSEWGYGDIQKQWCGITAATMFFNYYIDHPITPKEVYEYCRDSCGTWDAWNGCGAKYFLDNELTIDYDVPHTKDEYIKRLGYYVCNLKKPVIAEISLVQGIDHFVVVTEVNSDSVFYNDPWYGEERESSHSDFFESVQKKGTYQIRYKSDS